ncbi:hypothetical protein SAMN06265784_1202 [Paraburkholderia susongensis]|uniref:Uncharacterized protein n=1 Tax=Paraburkholderia susongensis TaxID=1515439 RepID=A0A1X7M556_9BURK|nr:hypothetical protein SAMN06265784_1202 [Paraburkholderia susongensis]
MGQQSRLEIKQPQVAGTTLLLAMVRLQAMAIIMLRLVRRLQQVEIKQ